MVCLLTPNSYNKHTKATLRKNYVKESCSHYVVVVAAAQINAPVEHTLKYISFDRKFSAGEWKRWKIDFLNFRFTFDSNQFDFKWISAFFACISLELWSSLQHIAVWNVIKTLFSFERKLHEIFFSCLNTEKLQTKPLNFMYFYHLVSCGFFPFCFSNIPSCNRRCLKLTQT